MYGYTIATHLFPRLAITVANETGATSLPEITLTYPSSAVGNAQACQDFESYLAATYDVTSSTDANNITTLVLKPLAGSWQPDPAAYFRRFSQHMAARYNLPITSIYKLCGQANLQDALVKYTGQAGEILKDKLVITDKPDTTTIEAKIQPCSAQEDFCSWLETLYVCERTKTENDGVVTLTLKKLRATHDTLKNADHLILLATAIHNAWGVDYNNIPKSILPQVARDYCQAMLDLRKRRDGDTGTAPELYTQDIVVVGAGFSGVSFIKQFLEQAMERKLGPLRIQIVERNPEYLAAGLAYGAARPEHRVNVEARYLSLDPEKPNDFVDWIKSAKHEHSIGAERFLDIPDNLDIPSSHPEKAAVQRRLYHYYLMDRLNEIVEETTACGVADIDITFSEAIAADVMPEHVQVKLKNGETVQGTHLVLANGHGPVTVPPFLSAVATHARVVTDQWSQEDKIDAIFKDSSVKKVVVLGTGLSAMDILVTAVKQGFFDDPSHRLVLMSRGGHTHPILDDSADYKEPHLDVEKYRDRLPHQASEVAAFVGTVFTELQESGLETIGRPYTKEEVFFTMARQIPAFMKAANLNVKDVLPLLKQNSSLITTTAVPMAQIIGAAFTKYVGTGQVEIVSADPKNVADAEGKLVIAVEQHGEAKNMPVDALLSALPPQSTPQKVPLLLDLINKGVLRQDPDTGIGLDVTDGSYRAIDSQGAAHPNLYILGPVIGGEEMERHGLIGPLFQIVSGLRPQAEAIAHDVIQSTLAPSAKPRVLATLDT